MTDDFPEDWELFAFFEQEPDSIDKDEAEFFGGWSFTLTLEDGDILVFSVSQNFRDLDVTIRREQSKEINLAVRGDLRSIKLERLHGLETLVAAFGTEPNIQEARLTLRPTFRLDWGPATS